MKEYQKIPTYYKIDSKTHTFSAKVYDPYVDYLKDLHWIVSEKVDGMNIRVHYDGHKVEWNGRTDKANLPKEVEELLQNTFGESEVVFEQLFGNKDVILFMECYGGKIQGGLYGGKERLIGFDIMVNDSYLDKTVIGEIFDKFNVPCVEFYEVAGLHNVVADCRDALVYAHISPLCENRTTVIEGFVCVPKCRIYDNQGNRVIVKIKVRDIAKVRSE